MIRWIEKFISLFVLCFIYLNFSIIFRVIIFRINPLVSGLQKNVKFK